MKKILHLLTIALLFSSSLMAQETLIISEVADPADDYTGRFIELYNVGDAAIDFSTTTYYFARQSNGGSTWQDVQLTGSIDAGATYVIADQAAFSTLYGSNPDLDWNGVNGNGDDAYYLYKDGDHSTGTLVDIYGELDTDGSGTAWEYTDGRAVRIGGMTGPSATWTASEWTITSEVNVAGFDPGTHSNVFVPDEDPPVWEVGYPAIQNVLDVSFDLATQLDESSTVYYVVLESGATEPTVEEVLAATGSSGAAAVASGNFAAGTSETIETVSGLTVDVSYDVYVVAADDEAVPNVQAAVTKLTATTAVQPDQIMYVDFETDLSPFTAVSVTGDQVWAQDAYSGNGYAIMSGYSGGAQENEDWLISPVINLDGSTDNTFSFTTAMNYSGPDLTVYISTDFNGTYDVTNVQLATWTDVTSQVSLSPGGWEWVNSGDVDLSTYSGDIYVAFVYTSTTDGAATWEVDDFTVNGFLAQGSDASLSDLTIDGTTIADFDAAKTSYTLELPAGTTTVPVVDYTLNDENATAVVTDATDLSGDEAARTTTIEVTAQDGTTIQTYTIVFNPVIEVANLAELRAATDLDRTYKITGEVVLTQKDSYRNKKYLEDETAAIEIDDDPGVITTEYNIGDGVTGLTGTLESYFDMLQMHPTEDPGAATSTGNAVEPQVITVDEFKTNFEDYEAEFVKIEGVSFADAGGIFENGNNYDVSANEDTTVVRVAFYGTSLTGIEIPNVADVAGVALWHYSTAKVAPRSADDLTIYSADATLSDLMVDGTTVEGFDAAITDYDVVLPAGTTEVPAVTYTTGSANASVNVTEATNVTGTEEERTTTIEVTSEDGTSTTVYIIVFSVDNTGVDNNSKPAISLYPVPASNELHVSGLIDVDNIQIINITGKVIRNINVNSSKLSIDISGLDAGLYMLRADDHVMRFIKK